MCGRIQFDRDGGEPAVRRMAELVAERFPGVDLPSGEAFPGSRLPVLLAGAEKADVVLMNWGIPLTSGKLLINARSETAAGKRMFASAFRERRCALLTTGFYEWANDGEKTKYLFRLPEKMVVYLACIYDPERRFVVLTEQANESMREVHDRMPVLLRQGEVRLWLRESGFAEACLLREGPALVKTAAGK